MLAYAGVGSSGAPGATHSDPCHGSHRAATAGDDLAAKLAAAQQRCNRGATESPKSEEARDATDAADTDAADTGTDAADTDTDAADAQFKEQAVNGRALLGTQFTCFTSTNRYSGNSYLLY
jgi:hypothetical protein